MATQLRFSGCASMGKSPSLSEALPSQQQYNSFVASTSVVLPRRVVSRQQPPPTRCLHLHPPPLLLVVIPSTLEHLLAIRIGNIPNLSLPRTGTNKCLLSFCNLQLLPSGHSEGTLSNLLDTTNTTDIAPHTIEPWFHQDGMGHIVLFSGSLYVYALVVGLVPFTTQIQAWDHPFSQM